MDCIFQFPTTVPFGPVPPSLCAMRADAPGLLACLLGSASGRPAGDWWTEGECGEGVPPSLPPCQD